MKNLYRIVVTVVTFSCACLASAQTVYKTVDAQGRVTYSSTPPPDAPEEKIEQVPIAPGPTSAQQEAAAQRARELEVSIKHAENQRQEVRDEAKETASKGEQELRKARTALEEAQAKSDDDWQYLATGGRVLKQDYLDRVKAAEHQVDQAEKALHSSGASRR